MSGVIVIGAGMGGLAAAATLAHQGVDVTVLDRADSIGGKVAVAEIDGRRIDCGPTVMTMRWVLDAVFEATGARTEDHLDLTPLDVLARHAWRDGAQLDLYADEARSAEAIAAFASPGEATAYRAFCADVRRTFQTLDKTFLAASRPNLPQLLARIAASGPQGVPNLLHLQPYASMWHQLGTFFRDLRLRQLFARYATYCGASPFAAPATLMLVAHVEKLGVWSVGGGMEAIATALRRRIEAAGARVLTHRHVTDILTDAGKVSGVRLADGERLAASSVVFAGDVAALAGGHLGAAARAAVGAVSWRSPPRSLSAVTLSLLAPVRGFPLARHTVFFSDDYPAEFRALFGRREMPTTPTLYVCAQDRGVDAPPPQCASERLFILANAPADGDRRPMTPQEIALCRDHLFAHLSRCGLDVDWRDRDIRISTPSDFHRRFPGTGGALYGAAGHGWTAAFRRWGSRTRLPGLYLAGGSVHPGPGVPMAMQSGRLAAACLLADSVSARTWRRGAMPGGMSTASATTASLR
jgi:1-hydroxycarotenoid 3,4-desaturase